MRSPTPAVLSGLSIAAAATLIGGIVSAFAVGGSSTTSASGPGSTATTVPSGGAPSTLPGAGAESTLPSVTAPGATSPAGPGPGAKPTTTVAPLATAAGPVGDPGQPTAEAPGTYTYSYSVTSGSETTSGTLTDKVTTVSTSGGVTKQTSVDTGDQSVSQHLTVEWRPTGMFEVQRTFTFNGQTAQCNWNPAIQELVSGLAVGRQWTLDGSCQVILYGQPVSIKLSGKASLTKKERLQVGTDAVNVWVVSNSYDIVATSPTVGTIKIHNDSTDRVSGRLGMLVEEDGTQTFSSSSSQGTRKSSTHLGIKSIHPAP